MPDVASRFRLAFVEHKADYRINLQVCCDHYRSVSEVCRRLKINRQQFNRYLMGSATPSRHNHKLISDFFGLEEDELFGPHAAFSATFKRRTAAQDPPAVLRHHAGLLRAVSGGCAAFRGRTRRKSLALAHVVINSRLPGRTCKVAIGRKETVVFRFADGLEPTFFDRRTLAPNKSCLRRSGAVTCRP